MTRGYGICYCYTCDKEIKSLGIARHRAMHRDRNENCKIKFSNGVIESWSYGETSKIEDKKETK